MGKWYGGDGDYQNYDALGLGELIAKGEISAMEALESAIERLEVVNPRLNAAARLR